MEDLSCNDVTVLGWAIPRPTGRWHQSIVVTARHVWITPELTLTKNEQMTAAAAADINAFHEYLNAVQWNPGAARCYLADISGLEWNALTGRMQIAASKKQIIQAAILDRQRGTELEPPSASREQSNNPDVLNDQPEILSQKDRYQNLV